MVPADNAANSVIVVCRLNYINTCTLKEETYIDEKSVFNSHSNELPYKFAENVKNRKNNLPTMYWLPKRHKKRIKLDLVQTLSLLLLKNFLTFYPLASLLSNLMSSGTMRQCMKGQEKICFGL